MKMWDWCASALAVQELLGVPVWMMFSGVTGFRGRVV
jgi:hypothetical protein